MPKRIIDIPEELLTEITRVGLLRVSDEKISIVDKAVQNGTPLTEHKDCVPREAVRRIITSPRTQDQMLNALNSLVSVYPKSEFSEVDCNNCKNNLHRGDGTTYCATSDGMCHFESECDAEDCISRSQTIKDMCLHCDVPNCRYRDKGIIHASCDDVDILKRVPSVYPKSDKENKNE